MSNYPVTARSRVRRSAKRAVYDRAQVHAILDASILAHIGYRIGEQVYVTPTGFWREGEHLYWHGASASRMTQAQAAGLPVCLTVTHLDGLVLARSGFHHSVNYRSVMAFGQSFEVSDPQERAAALARYVERIFPGRNARMRGIDPTELKATLLIGMRIEEASAKVRSGPPIDDEADLAVPVWGGVLELQNTVRAVTPDATSSARADRPEGLEAWLPGTSLDALLSAGAAAINSGNNSGNSDPHSGVTQLMIS